MQRPEIRRSITLWLIAGCLPAIWLISRTAPVNAQNTSRTCTASASPAPNVRAEGMREPVADMWLTCNDTAPQPMPFDIRVTLNTAVTTPLLAGTPYTQAILIEDGVTPDRARFCGGAQAPADTNGNCPAANAWLAHPLGANLGYEFRRVSAGSVQKRFRLTNIRANAAALNALREAKPVNATVSVHENERTTQTWTPFPVATARRSLNFGVVSRNLPTPASGGFNVPLLTSTSPTPFNFGATPAEMHFMEAERLALERRGGVDLWTSILNESARQYGTTPITTAEKPPRVAVRFNITAQNVQIWVATTCTSPGGILRLIDPATGLPIGLPAQAARVSLQEGRGRVVYELQPGQPPNDPVPQQDSLAPQSNDPNQLDDYTCLSTLGYDRTGTSGTAFVSGQYEDSAFPENPEAGVAASFYLLLLAGPDAVGDFLGFDPESPDRNFQAIETILGESGATNVSLPTGSREHFAQNDSVRAPAGEVWWNVVSTAPNPPTNLNVEPIASTTRSPGATVNWLTTEANGTRTPLPIKLSINPAGLAPGTYQGGVRLSGTGLSAFTVPLTLTIRPPGPSFSPWGLANAGSYVPNLVAPGEAIVVFGTRFGPPALARAELTADGKLGTRIGDTRVLFDGVPAPMIYAVNGQVSCLAPFALAGKTVTSVQVEYQGVLSPAIRIAVISAIPALLTADSSGFGQAAALNQDNTFNSVRGDAPGNVVTLFGVGAPNTTPGGADGAITAAPLPRFTGTTAVFLDGRSVPASEILYLGPAPGLVNGVFQANVRIPASARPGSRIETRIQFGDYVTQPGVYITVR